MTTTTVGHATSHVRTLTQVTDYAEAERLVDRLSDAGFPVERVRIVGIDVYSVEQVTGRLTNVRAALTGAVAGALLGVAAGLLFALFTTGVGWLALVAGGALVGATWGGALGFVTHWSTAGRRDFSSVRNLKAMRYAVQVESTHADDAVHILGLP
ncbi:hypothetical protein GCM10009557_69190 [Virgisporangium ochraceum]|uniref:General stress protein 17M-like domain-containing protein n=1 Tax=Virgisporangium ochraceum TaxID=65505 RepID=A0A8J4EHU4_9ACTN|nr:general stress protein [Virgisporangium ochraceum]GIJ72552.1 hypothetical protein Voc01_074690 [Virgisporangium ochraceum]